MREKKKLYSPYYEQYNVLSAENAKKKDSCFLKKITIWWEGY